MKFQAFTLILACTACGEGSHTNPTLVGDWVYDYPSGAVGIGLSLTEDQTFGWILLEMTSTTSGNIEGHAGVYQDSPTELTLSQDKSSCSGDVREDWTFKYQLKANSLVIIDSNGVLAFKRNYSAPSVWRDCNA